MTKEVQSNSLPKQSNLEIHKLLKPKKLVSRRLFPKSDLTSENEKTLDALYNETVGNFNKRWNFDVNNEKPLSGTFKWSEEKLKNQGNLLQSSNNV
jgi:hypothetical protein